MFQSLRAIIAATVLLSNGLVAFASPARRQVSPVGTLRPIADSHKCIGVRAASRSNGTPVQILDCNGSGTQNWNIQRGSTKIQLDGTNVCLDAGSGPADGVKMRIWECFDGLPAQQWTYIDDNNIILEGTEFCLDLTNGFLANSNQLQIWTCNSGNNNQVWLEGPPGTPTPPPPPPPSAGRAVHPNGNANKCIDVKGAVFANGTPVQIFDCNGSKAQRWTFTDGNTKVRLTGTNFCLDATSGSPASGQKMKIWQCFDNLPAQAWTYTSSHNLKLQSANQCLHLTDGDFTNGKQLQVSQCVQGNTDRIWN